MATYKVVQHDHSHYVLGLECWESSDSILIYSYPGGDIDTFMKDKSMMHSALYDLFQVTDALSQGDTFETEFGTFVCDGVDVLAA